MSVAVYQLPIRQICLFEKRSIVTSGTKTIIYELQIQENVHI